MICMYVDVCTYVVYIYVYVGMGMRKPVSHSGLVVLWAQYGVYSARAHAQVSGTRSPSPGRKGQ